MKQPTTSRRTIWSWALFDFANSPFTTLVVTFIYAAYFTGGLATDEAHGTVLWSRGVTVTALFVAFLSPILGAVADRGGFRKRFLAISTVVCIVATTALYWFEADRMMTALVVFVIANIAFEMGMVFYNAFLPDIAPPGKIGRVSGYGWALGYGGGLLALVVALVALVFPEQPLFGFATEGGQNIRASNLLVAAWLAIFSLPLFLWVPEDRSAVSHSGSLWGNTFGQLRRTFVEIRGYRQIARFLFARLLYNDGVVTIFAFGGIYAAGTFGFGFEKLVVFGIVLNVTAGLGAFGFGYLDDRLGAKLTIQCSNVGLIVATVIAVLSPSETWFWIAGMMVGIFSGPNQSASRSMMGRFVPPEKENEFFGFFAFSGKATAFLGPLLLGVITDATGSQRAGVSVVAVLLLLGAIFLTRVDEREGELVAARNEG